MATKAVSRDELGSKVLAAFKFEPCCEGALTFEIASHQVNELSVNWTVKLLSPDLDGRCYYAAASTAVGLLAKAYRLAEWQSQGLSHCERAMALAALYQGFGSASSTVLA